MIALLFQSLPAVPSSPFLHDGTIRLLSELGLSEDDYALPGSRAHQFVLDFVGYFNVVIPFSLAGLEHSYVCGVDRNHFDNVVWKHMESHAPYVTARQGFAMTDVLKDSSGKVTGIVGKALKGKEERITADLVVGADGRFSVTAHKFGAKMVEERNEFTTGGYETQWEGVLPYAEGMSSEAGMYSNSQGYMAVFVPVAQGRYYVAAYMRSQFVQRGKMSPEEFYLASLQRIPKAWKRLENARRVTDLEAIRPVENGYREAYGPGWALVGDAFHYKDPIDGQGIYDALTETKVLAEAIGQWKSGSLTWEQAGAQYKEKAWAATHPMFEMTVSRIKATVHTSPPPLIINTMIKWMLTDPGYQKKFLQMLSRAIEPSEVPAMPSAGMVGRGILHSIQSLGKANGSSQPSAVVEG